MAASLEARIREDMVAALKAKDAGRAGVLRFLLSLVHNLQIERRGKPVSDADAVDVLRKEVKKRREAIELFRGGGRLDLVEKEEEELSVTQAYLPPELSRAAVEKTVDEVIRSGASDFNSAMKESMKRLRGQADGKLVGDIVKEKLAAPRP